MARIDGQPLIDEEKEKARIEWENKVLYYLMPIVGAIAFVVGVVGFVLVVNYNIGIAVFLILLATLGLGGIAYGVIGLIKKLQGKRQKEQKEPDQQ